MNKPIGLWKLSSMLALQLKKLDVEFCEHSSKNCVVFRFEELETRSILAISDLDNGIEKDLKEYPLC